MKQLRFLGLGLGLYGAVWLALLFTPYRQWALEHSIAHAVSRTDRRVGNTVDGAVDLPMAVAGSAVVMFAGLWIGVLVPWVVRRKHDEMRQVIEQNMRTFDQQQRVSGSAR